MKILICICTFKRNKELIRCLKEFKNIKIPRSIKIKFLVLDNTKNFLSKEIVKKFKKKFKFPLLHLNEKKRGVVNARNRCLKEIKKIKCEYAVFFDDDCIVDKKWFLNFYKLNIENKIEIVTGPQVHNNKIANLFEKDHKKDLDSVKWAATNNVAVKRELLIRENIFFDIALNKFGMGEDQLFFLKLKKKGYKILWSKTLKVKEKTHRNRLDSKWIKDRSYRLGVIGYYIDKNLNGILSGYFINYFKCILYFLSAITFLFKVGKIMNYYKFLNLIYRSYGRFLGPLVFGKIDFYKK